MARAFTHIKHSNYSITTSDLPVELKTLIKQKLFLKKKKPNKSNKRNFLPFSQIQTQDTARKVPCQQKKEKVV